jgi:hypothetical protein
MAKKRRKLSISQLIIVRHEKNGNSFLFILDGLDHKIIKRKNGK